jgi:hypothetical protein
LKEASVPFWFHVFLAGGTSYLTAMMIVKAGPSYDTMTSLALDKGPTYRLGGAVVTFMVVVAFLTFIISITVITMLPFHDGAALPVA